MAVSGKMEITGATLVAGSAAISAQRGTQEWGANYTFTPSGLQNDILVISDTLKGMSTGGVETSGIYIAPTVSGNITLAASGVTKIGSNAAPLAVSGIYMLNQAGVPMRLVITAGGLVSGVVG